MQYKKLMLTACLFRFCHLGSYESLYGAVEICVWLVASVAQSLNIHKTTKQKTILRKLMDHNGIHFISAFNFPDVVTVASHSPGRVCLALPPPVGRNIEKDDGVAFSHRMSTITYIILGL